MALEPWRPLRPGPGPIVLCVDFSQARARAQAGFAELAALLPERYAVWGTEEAAWRSVDPRPEPAIDALVDRCPEGAVAGVLGYCAGGALACAVARRLARPGTAGTPVVLFDPVAVTAQTLRDSYDAAARGIAAVAPVPGRPPARDAPTPAGTAPGDAAADGIPGREAGDHGGKGLPATEAGDHGDDAAELVRLADALSGRYASLAGPACAAARVPAAIADQLRDRVTSYLRYLVYSATVRLDPPGPTLVVLSAAHRPERVHAAWPQVRLATDQAGLLAGYEAARLAARALAPEALVPEALAGQPSAAAG